jgi:hypothetical protein
MAAVPARARAVSPAAVLGLTGWLLAIGVGTAALVIRLVRPDPIPPNTFGMGDAGMVAFVVLGTTWATVGAVLVARRPSNAVGPVVLIVGIGYAASIFWSAWTAVAYAQGPAGLEAARLFAWLTGLATFSGIGLFYLALIFPTGRGYTQAWDRAARLVLFLSVMTAISVLIQPGPLHVVPGLANPFGFGLDLRPLFNGRVVLFVGVGAVVFLPVLTVGLAARYRAAGQVERLQLRWFFSSVVLTALALSLVAAGVAVDDAALGELPLVAFALAGTMVPIAIGIAILRHHLYDLDRIISRTIGWTVVSGALVGLFGVAVVGLQAVLTGITQGQTLAVAASTLLAFALFQPIRRRVQTTVDRRFDRARYDAEQIVTVFSDRLRHQLDLQALGSEVGRVASASVRPQSVALWLRNVPTISRGPDSVTMSERSTVRIRP